jgi:hypothetical protein
MQMTDGTKIIDALTEATIGDFASVTIGGVKWVRESDLRRIISTQVRQLTEDEVVVTNVRHAPVIYNFATGEVRPLADFAAER